MFYSNKTPRCNISRALSPPTIKNINLRNTSWEILLLFNSRRISVSRSNFVTLLLLFCFQTNKNIKVYTLNGRRVSEDVTARDCPGKRTAWMPIQLEQKALYRYICYKQQRDCSLIKLVFTYRRYLK